MKTIVLLGFKPFENELHLRMAMAIAMAGHKVDFELRNGGGYDPPKPFRMRYEAKLAEIPELTVYRPHPGDKGTKEWSQQERWRKEQEKNRRFHHSRGWKGKGKR